MQLPKRTPLPFGELLHSMVAEGLTYTQIAAKYPGNNRWSVYKTLRRWRKKNGVKTQGKCIHCNDDVRLRSTRVRRVPIVCAYCKRHHPGTPPTITQLRAYREDGLSWDDIHCLHTGTTRGALFLVLRNSNKIRGLIDA